MLLPLGPVKNPNPKNNPTPRRCTIENTHSKESSPNYGNKSLRTMRISLSGTLTVVQRSVGDVVLWRSGMSFPHLGYEVLQKSTSSNNKN
jgi:hypothetical protein